MIPRATVACKNTLFWCAIVDKLYFLKKYVNSLRNSTKLFFASIMLGLSAYFPYITCTLIIIMLQDEGIQFLCFCVHRITYKNVFVISLASETMLHGVVGVIAPLLQHETIKRRLGYRFFTAVHLFKVYCQLT